MRSAGNVGRFVVVLLDGVEELAPATLEREDMPVLALHFAQTVVKFI